MNVNDNGRKVHIEQTPKGIKMDVTGVEDGKEVTESYDAKDADELKRDNPEAAELYERWGGNGSGNHIIIRGGVHLGPQGRLPLQPGPDGRPALPPEAFKDVREMLKEQVRLGNLPAEQQLKLLDQLDRFDQNQEQIERQMRERMKEMDLRVQEMQRDMQRRLHDLPPLDLPPDVAPPVPPAPRPVRTSAPRKARLHRPQLPLPCNQGRGRGEEMQNAEWRMQNEDGGWKKSLHLRFLILHSAFVILHFPPAPHPALSPEYGGEGKEGSVDTPPAAPYIPAMRLSGLVFPFASVLLFPWLGGCTPQKIAREDSFGPSKLRVHPTFTQVKDWTGDGKPDGIEAVVELLDSYGEPTRGSGKFLFELTDYLPENPHGNSHRLAEPWVQVLDTRGQQAAHWSTALRAYTFQLPVPKLSSGFGYVLDVSYETTVEGPSGTTRPARLFDRLVIQPPTALKKTDKQIRRSAGKTPRQD